MVVATVIKVVLSELLNNVEQAASKFVLQPVIHLQRAHSNIFGIKSFQLFAISGHTGCNQEELRKEKKMLHVFPSSPASLSNVENKALLIKCPNV